MKCTCCGKEVVTGARFCSSCGMPILDATVRPKADDEIEIKTLKKSMNDIKKKLLEEETARKKAEEERRKKEEEERKKKEEEARKKKEAEERKKKEEEEKRKRAEKEKLGFWVPREEKSLDEVSRKSLYTVSEFLDTIPLLEEGELVSVKGIVFFSNDEKILLEEEDDSVTAYYPEDMDNENEVRRGKEVIINGRVQIDDFDEVRLLISTVMEE